MINFIVVFSTLLIIGCYGFDPADLDEALESLGTEHLPEQNGMGPEKCRVKWGADILLKCPNANKQTSSFKPPVTWEFKSCEVDYKGIVCDNSNINNLKVKPSSWKELTRTNNAKLVIRNSNITHNGMYRCLHSGAIQKSFEVEIVNSALYESPLPEVVTLKITNSTSGPSDNLLIEFTILCNVSSKIPPSVLWFKKCDHNLCYIEFEGICYCNINQTVPIFNSGNFYLSKLNIFNANNIDSGLYACVAITFSGRDYKNVELNVPDDGTKLQPESFSLLCLFMVIFMVALMSMWFCYCFYKKKKKTKKSLKQHQKLIQPVISNCDNVVL